MSRDDELARLMRERLPVQLVTYRPPRACGLVIIDLIHGFCTVGAGNLAPRDHDPDIERMAAVTAELAREFRRRRLPVLAFLDTHEPDKPEPPYPPHCIKGSGEEHFIPQLSWLDDDPDVLIIRKDCIDPVVAAIEPSFIKGAHGCTHNRCIDWVNLHRLEAIVTVGICTDICDLDFASTMLSVRNHGLAPTLKEVVALERGMTTYDLPLDAARDAGLPATAAHPKAAAHHIGLYVMQSRGAILASEISFT
jgi:nicotinamidase-related amidase